jgi:hypothetical protein
MTSQHGAYALHGGLARLHAHRYRPISNTYCFCTAAMIRRRLCYVVCTLPLLFSIPPGQFWDSILKYALTASMYIIIHEHLLFYSV